MAYWNRIESGPGRFDTGELDRQIELAEQAGKQIIVCVGPVKTFGYPEFFVPGHHLPEPLREGALVEPAAYPALLEASTAFVSRLAERYRDREAIVAWQVEHDAVDPLGMEHSWRLSAAFVRREVQAVRAADPTRPVLMNGFLPTSAPVRMQQDGGPGTEAIRWWWRTSWPTSWGSISTRGTPWWPGAGGRSTWPATSVPCGGDVSCSAGPRRAGTG